MRSVKSYFSPTLFRKNLARFWPVWSLYGAVWLFALPLYILNSAPWWTPDSACSIPLSVLCDLGLFLSLVFGVLAAMGLFSYLYNSRAVGMLHALPLRRRDLFLTNYLSGLCFFLLPHGAVFLLALAAEAVAGAVNLGSLCMWLLVQSLLCLFFFSFAVFCAMFTGNILALPAFYGILNGLAAGLVYLFQVLAREFIYGYYSVGTLTEVAAWLTPVLQLGTTMRVRYDTDVAYAQFYGLHVVLLYAVVGIVLTVLALLVYEKRHLETAGDVVAVPWVKPIFKYGVGFCSAVALGTFLYGVLFAYGPFEGPWTLLVLLLLWGAVGYFVAEMLLRKSFRVFRQGWKGCVVLLACLTGAVCAMEFDLTGFEGRVPDPAQVESVSITASSAPYDSLSHNHWSLSDPEDLELVARLHRAVVQRREEGDYSTRTVDGVTVDVADTDTLQFIYTLKDGSTVYRSYDSYPRWAADLTDPDSPTALLNQLLNNPARVKDAYFALYPDFKGELRLVDAVVTMLMQPDGSYLDSQVVPAADLEELLGAIERDLDAGRLGRRYVLDTMERMENCYLSDLELTFLLQWEDEPSINASRPSNYTVRIGLQASATETLAVLEKCGAVNGEDQLLVTHAEDSRRYNAEKNPDEMTDLFIGDRHIVVDTAIRE